MRRPGRAWSAALVGAGALAAVCLASGCADLGYLAQSASGHIGLMRAARPVPDWLADPATPAPLRDTLALSQRLRDFAVSELGLPDSASYRRYADLGRKAAVWNVAAAPAFSLRLRTWCFPVTGCVGYRGYYSEAEAQAFGAQLRAEGLEVAVYPVPAYSTLGKLEWLGGDPLLNTFIQRGEQGLAQLMFHELAHQVVYVAGDTMFNESYATAVERLGWARWRERQGRSPTPQELAQQASVERRRDEFRALTARYREALARLYASDLAEPARREAKARLMAAMREEHRQLRQERWEGFAGYDAFFAQANNATLAMQAAYVQLVPAFETLFGQQARDFGRFHTEVRRLAALPRREREAALQALLPAGPEAAR